MPIAVVIAPDLPGIRMHSLGPSLGGEEARVVGHDIGLMVAYGYAAQFPQDVEKLVVMDAFLPGQAAWERVHNNPGLWYFRFNGPTPDELVQRREQLYFEHFWNTWLGIKHSRFPKRIDLRTLRPTLRRDACQPDSVLRLVHRGDRGFRSTRSDRVCDAGAGDLRRETTGNVLGQQMKLVVSDVTVFVLKDAGRWILEKRQKETAEGLLSLP